jgi:hypothetical protein
MRREYQNIEGYRDKKENEKERWMCQGINGTILIMRVKFFCSNSE